MILFYRSFITAIHLRNLRSNNHMSKLQVESANANNLLHPIMNFFPIGSIELPEFQN